MKRRGGFPLDIIPVLLAVSQKLAFLVPFSVSVQVRPVPRRHDPHPDRAGQPRPLRLHAGRRQGHAHQVPVKEEPKSKGKQRRTKERSILSTILPSHSFSQV